MSLTKDVTWTVCRHHKSCNRHQITNHSQVKKYGLNLQVESQPKSQLIFLPSAQSVNHSNFFALFLLLLCI